MRNSTELNEEIEKLEKTLRGKELQTYNLKHRIEVLRNTLSKVQHKEELAKTGIYVNIVSVEREKDIGNFGVTSLFLITTDKGLHWLATKKLKKGKHKMTQRQHDDIKRINEEYNHKG